MKNFKIRREKRKGRNEGRKSERNNGIKSEKGTDTRKGRN